VAKLIIQPRGGSTGLAALREASCSRMHWCGRRGCRGASARPKLLICW